MTGADFLGGEPTKQAPDEFAKEDEDFIEVEVHPENRTAVEVFRNCQMTLVGGMGVFHQGISAQEFKAACWAMGLELDGPERKETLGKIKFMAQVVASETNEKNASKAKTSRKR